MLVILFASAMCLAMVISALLMLHNEANTRTTAPVARNPFSYKAVSR